jgi:hypothetical protein
MVQMRTVQSATDVTAIMQILDTDGAVIVSGLIPPKHYRSLQEELDRQFDQAPFCRGLFYGERTKRIHSLVSKSSICRQLIIEPLILEIMNAALGPYCERIQLNLTQGIQIWPGELAQILHRDDVMFPAPTKNHEFMMNALWAYSDFTRDNGATLLVPGSHKWSDPQRQATPEEIVQAEMAAGDVLLYRGSLVHAGGENHSERPRTGLAISYCLGWLRQSENQYFCAPPDLARDYPKLLQDLLGYCVHRPNLGMYEGNEPSILFSERDPNNKLITSDWLTARQNDWIRQRQSPRGNSS